MIRRIARKELLETTGRPVPRAGGGRAGAGDCVGRYHDEWRGYFLPRIFRGERLDSLLGLPRFSFVEESVAEVAARVGRSLGILLPASAIVGAAGLRALRRYPIVG